MRLPAASALLLACLAAAGCREAPTADPPANAAAVAERAPLENIDASVALDQLEGIENHLPPPARAEPGAAPDEPRFAGRWAAGESYCSTAAWRFAADGLVTPAGSVCRFRDVREVPGGYDIEARCTAEAPERDDTLRVRFPESAGGMTFESDSIADSGLVPCPAGQ